MPRRSKKGAAHSIIIGKLLLRAIRVERPPPPLKIYKFIYTDTKLKNLVTNKG